MVYDLALQITLAVCLWILMDLPGARGPRASKLPVALAAASCAVWVLGERWVRLAASPDEVLLGRRILFAGASLLPVAWLWTAAAAARVAWLRRAPALIALAALPLLVPYAYLYGTPNSLFTSWTERPPVHGPLFLLFAGAAWAWILLGTGHFLLAASRLGRSSSARFAAIFLGGMLPLAANVVHVLFVPFSHDPTPILLGVGAVLIRFSVIDSGIAAFLPIGQRRVFDQLRTGVVVADLADVVVDANPAARTLLGVANPVGRRLAELLAVLPAAGDRVVEPETVPLRGSLGEIGRVALLTDRTEAARLERDLAQVQKLESIGIVTTGLAHEINNPLGVVLGNLWLIDDVAKRLGEPETLAALPASLRASAADLPDLVGDALNGAERIRRLIQNLMHYARPPGRRDAGALVDLRSVARKAIAIASAGLPEEAIHGDWKPAPLVRGSEEQLIQIVFNLLVNAIQASGGRAAIDVTLEEARGGALLRVLDRGQGIAPEVLPHVFDPFFSTRPRGEAPGLGLAVGLALARRHGGTIDGLARPGGGAIFELWLPSGEAPGA